MAALKALPTETGEVSLFQLLLGTMTFWPISLPEKPRSDWLRLVVGLFRLIKRLTVERDPSEL